MMLFGLLVVGCNDAKKSTDGENKCIDALCYPTCDTKLKNDFEGEGYMVVRFAYCHNDTKCKCYFGCEQNACSTYCREREGAMDGYCEFLSCVCTFRQYDGGDAQDAN